MAKPVTQAVDDPQDLRASIGFGARCSRRAGPELEPRDAFARRPEDAFERLPEAGAAIGGGSEEECSPVGRALDVR
jgi:hypothetical protein